MALPISIQEILQPMLVTILLIVGLHSALPIPPTGANPIIGRVKSQWEVNQAIPIVEPQRSLEP